VRRPPAPALVLVAVASVQIGAAIARQLFGRTGPAGTTLLRLSLSALVLGLVVRPKVRSLPAPAVRAALLFGLVLAAMNLTFYEAIRTVPLGVAVTVEFVGPLLVALAGARRLLHLLWVALAAAGVVLLTHGGRAPLPGLLLAGLAGLFWGGYILLSQHIGRLLPGTTGLALALPVAALAVLPFGAAGAVRGLLADPVTVLVAGLGVALLSSVTPYALELTALRTLSTTTFGVLLSLEPAGAAAAGFLLLGQTLGLRQLLALVAVSAASLGITLTDGGRTLPPID